jgi:hypothetical protein
MQLFSFSLGLESGNCERLGFVEDEFVETICYCDITECNTASQQRGVTSAVVFVAAIFTLLISMF